MEQLELPFGDEIRKLSEEIVDDKSKKYIYESPDGGKTIYRREFMKSEREIISDFKSEMNKRKNMIEGVTNNKRWSGKYEDFAVREKQVDREAEENLEWYEKWKKDNFNDFI